MEIKRVHVGGWFQRTRLHLGEIYDFLRTAESPLLLNAQTLKQLQEALEITELELKIDVLEYVFLTTRTGITVRIFEDGLIVLATEHSHDLHADIGRLTSYYEEQLSAALSYIFSLGAPVPKELANIKTVYPYFVSVSDAHQAEVDALFGEFDQSQYFSVEHEAYQIFRGDKLYIVNQNGATDDEVQRFIEEQIFLREFRGQMHRYLNLHRTIWEKIAEVKERGEMRGSEIPAFKKRIDEYAKTIDFIDTRINQMGTYLHTRESIANRDKRLTNFETVLGYKHETLQDTLEYMQEIWVLTQKYVASAAQLFGDLQAKSTNNSVKNLTVVTSMGVGATLIGLFTKTSAPEFTSFGLMYFTLLVGLGYGTNRFMKWYYARKSYGISDIKIAHLD